MDYFMTTSSIIKLKNEWPRLHDVDRARAIFRISKSGLSIRQIAVHLECSESSLRRLLKTLKAPAADQDLARQGKISTNELVRRAKTAEIQRIAKQQEKLALQRDRDAQKAANTICDWLAQIDLYGPACEMIVDEVRRKLHTTPISHKPFRLESPKTPVSEIIARTKPPADTNGDFDTVGWHSEWLRTWVFHAFPDQDIRDTALDISLEKQGGW
jgi:hypothetical protein